MFKLTTKTPKQNRSDVRQISVKVKIFKQIVKKFHHLQNYFTIRYSLIFVGLVSVKGFIKFSFLKV